MVFEAEKAKAEEIWADLKQDRLRFPDYAGKRDSVLCVEVDGAMIQTRKLANGDNLELDSDPDSKEKKTRFDGKYAGHDF